MWLSLRSGLVLCRKVGRAVDKEIVIFDYKIEPSICCSLSGPLLLITM